MQQTQRERVPQIRCDGPAGLLRGRLGSNPMFDVKHGVRKSG